MRAYALQAEYFECGLRGEPVDPEPMLALFDPAVVVEEVADIPDAQDYRGYEGLVRWFMNLFELYQELRVDVGEPEENGEKVLVPTHQYARGRSGVDTEWDIVHVWTVED